MTDQIQDAGETTEQLETGVEEQSQQADNSTEEATVQEGAEPSQSNKTPAWVEKRFAEMTQRRHEAERRAETLERERDTALALANSRLGEGEQTQQPAPKQQQAPVNDEQRIQQAAADLVETQRYNKRADEVYAAGIADNPDFDSSLKTLGMLGASPEFFKAIVDLDDAHKVLNALGSNPEEAARILALPPLKQGRELERLASKPAPKAAKKPVSNAPDPISNRVDGSGAKAVDLDNASIDDFMKARNARPRR